MSTIAIVLISIATAVAVVAALMIFLLPWKSRKVTWGYGLMLFAVVLGGTTGVWEVLR